MHTSSRPSLLQVARFWSIFSFRERVLFLFLLVIAIVAGGLFVTSFFRSFIDTVPEVGGNYTEGVVEEIRFINPILASNETERSISSLVFRGLFRYSARGELTPDVAESYSISDDGKRYTVIIKKDVTWQDGKSFTANDILFTVAMIQNSDFRSPFRPNWQGVMTEKINEFTVVFILRQPYAPFIENLTIGIIPKHAWATIRPENSLQAELNIKPIGSGPYQFKKLIRSTTGTITAYTIDRRGDLRKYEPPYLETISFNVFGSEETIISSYQRGKIDGMNFISAENIEKIQKKSEVYSVQLPQIFALFFNQSKNKLLSDDVVREALDISINRDLLIEKVFANNAKALGSPLPPGTIGFDETALPPKKNNDRAEKILDSAGWIKNSTTGIRERKIQKTSKTPETINPLRVVITTSVWPDLVKVAEFVRDEWRAIGVDAVVEAYTIPELESQFIRPRSYEVLLFGESYGHDSDPFAFWHSTQIKHPGLNVALYSNKKVDSALETARQAKNRDEIAKKYRELQTIVAKDRPAVFLYTPNYFFIMRNTIRGVQTNSVIKPSERFNSAAEWFVHTDWKLVW